MERYLRARERGARLADAAVIAGISTMTAKYWSAGRLPRSYTGAPRKASRKMGGSGKPRGKARRMAIEGLYGPPRSGPLAGLNPEQIENLLLRAVLAGLKAVGWDPASISNRSKCELGERLRRETGLPCARSSVS